MSDAAIILSTLKTALDFVATIARRLWRRQQRPRLRLIRRFCPDEQGVKSAGTVRLFLENTSEGTAKGVLIKLKVLKPKDAYPGYKLFFNEDIGSLESRKKPSCWDTNPRPEVYEYRLKPGIFVNLGSDAALKIAWFIVVAEETTSPADLDLEFEWTVHCAGIPSNSDKIILDGIDLKRKLLTNLYESGQVIGYKIPSRKIPGLDDLD